MQGRTRLYALNQDLPDIVTSVDTEVSPYTRRQNQGFHYAAVEKPTMALFMALPSAQEASS